MLPLRTEATSLKRDGFRVCAASSTDHVREAIEYVLSDGQPVSDLTDEDYAWMMSRNRLFWWSSRPTLSQESIETLLFTTKCPLALISQVKVKPLRDPYLLRQGEDAVSYTWSKTVIKAYRLPIELLAFPDAPPILSGFPCLFQTRASTEDPGIRALPHQLAAQLMVFDDGPAAPPDQCSIDRLLEGQTPVYESTEYDVPPASNATMTFDLPPGVVANVATLTLIGKNNEQRTGIGFYACVERVDCLGIPLYTSVHQPSEVALARAAG